jgi:hypothetical protein
MIQNLKHNIQIYQIDDHHQRKYYGKTKENSGKKEQYIKTKIAPQIFICQELIPDQNRNVVLLWRYVP